MAAEEAKDPQRTIPRAPGGGILTLTVLAIGVMVFAGGVGDWRALSNINDPLPSDEDGGGQRQRLAAYAGVAGAVWPRRLLPRHHYGLLAADLLLARAGYLPAGLASSTAARAPASGNPRRGVVGIAAIFSDSLITISGMPLTACIVTMSVFGAIVMYITSMAALFKLRRSEPKLIRPFRAPLYPLAPAFALGMAVLCPWRWSGITCCWR